MPRFSAGDSSSKDGGPALMTVFEIAFVFAAGACIGSFLNVCIWRLATDRSLFWPGSHCPTCLRPIRWYDNLPVVSYVVLRARCRVCGARISIRYPLVELFTALAFVGLYWSPCSST